MRTRSSLKLLGLRGIPERISRPPSPTPPSLTTIPEEHAKGGRRFIKRENLSPQLSLRKQWQTRSSPQYHIITHLRKFVMNLEKMSTATQHQHVDVFAQVYRTPENNKSTHRRIGVVDCAGTSVDAHRRKNYNGDARAYIVFATKGGYLPVGEKKVLRSISVTDNPLRDWKRCPGRSN